MFNVVDFDLFLWGRQIWQILLLDLLLVWEHVVYNGFTVQIWIVSEKNRAGLHLELAIHAGKGMLLLQLLFIWVGCR